MGRDRKFTFVCVVSSIIIALSAFSQKASSQQPPVANYQGLWWAAPAGSQSGWGINLAHQGDIIFATWFTYGGASGAEARWFSMTAPKVSDNVYAGTLVLTTGSSYSAIPYDGGAFRVAPFTGSAVLAFDSPTTGTLTYQPGATVIVQPITLQQFGPLPACVWGAEPDLTKATNYTDLWWASPAGSEVGWGVNLSHQGAIIFVTWFTYALQGNAIWMSATAVQTAPNAYSGDLYRTSGPAWGSLPFDSSAVSYIRLGTMRLAFIDGNNALFSYNINSQGAGGSSSQTKEITRQVFREPGTVCH